MEGVLYASRNALCKLHRTHINVQSIQRQCQCHHQRESDCALCYFLILDLLVLNLLIFDLLILIHHLHPLRLRLLGPWLLRRRLSNIPIPILSALALGTWRGFWLGFPPSLRRCRKSITSASGTWLSEDLCAETAPDGAGGALG